MRDIDSKDPPATELIERMTSRIVNSLVIAAGVIALGIYAGGGAGDVEAPDYQIVPMSDGRVARLNTETGSIVTCDAARCTLILLRSSDLETLSEEERQQIESRHALPPPAAAPENGTVAPPAAAPAPQVPKAAPTPQPAQPQR
ncbi:MAG TPA: hypothetical protein VF693_02845 [Allosphingosinicella sp.]|jgi:hypothetical protein